MLDLEIETLIHSPLEDKVGALEKEIRESKKAEETLRRQNEYLTALHETALGLIDRLDQEELLEDHGNCDLHCQISPSETSHGSSTAPLATIA